MAALDRSIVWFCVNRRASNRTYPRLPFTVLTGIKPSVPGWGAKPEEYQALMDATQVYFDSSDGKTGVTGDKVGGSTASASLGGGAWRGDDR